MRAGRALTAVVGVMGAQAVTTVQMNDGTLLELDPRSRTEAGAFWTGVYEEDYRQHLILLCATFGPNFYDVGANVGLVVVPVARQLATGSQVVAFEPVRANITRLRRNLDVNQLRGVVVVECALGDAPGVLTIGRESARGATSGNAVLVPDGDEAHQQSVEISKVPVRTLDEVVATEGLLPPDVIKVDVEGAEVAFLAGAQETMATARPVILGEFNSGFMPRFGTTFLDVPPLLPPDYIVLSFRSSTAVVVTEAHVGLGDVLLVPREKLGRVPLTIED